MDTSPDSRMHVRGNKAKPRRESFEALKKVVATGLQSTDNKVHKSECV